MMCNLEVTLLVFNPGDLTGSLRSRGGCAHHWPAGSEAVGQLPTTFSRVQVSQKLVYMAPLPVRYTRYIYGI